VRARLIVVTGTGTGIGKTHVSCALLTALRATTRALGFKPVESGVHGDDENDGARLRVASHPTFHVKHPRAPYLLRRPVSPHLAARESGVEITLERIVAATNDARCLCDVLLVELAGGLFSPLGTWGTNAELLAALSPDAVVLVAPDRLGVLHDVEAARRAARGLRGARHPFDAIALVAPELADASTGLNAAELRGRELVAEVPRGTVDDLARASTFLAIQSACVT
jgi:dethiobiotin synthetase